jgi:hypothetical protein
MAVYIHAYCLNPDSGKPGKEELWIGPFDWTGITYNFLRAGYHDDDPPNHEQLAYDETTGFWHPFIHIIDERDEEGHWRRAHSGIDYTAGRYSDVYFDTDSPEHKAWILENLAELGRMTEMESA